MTQRKILIEVDFPQYKIVLDNNKILHLDFQKNQI